MSHAQHHDHARCAKGFAPVTAAKEGPCKDRTIIMPTVGRVVLCELLRVVPQALEDRAVWTPES